MIEIKNFSEKFNDIKLVNLHAFKDVRGDFSKLYTSKLFKNTLPKIDEVYFSTSPKNTIRGIHFQHEPEQLLKLITCVSGEITDVFIDLRKNSKTYGMFEALKLTGENNLGILIPEGFGHGYSVLSDSATVLYCQSGNYDAALESGINPLSIEVDWGTESPIISQKDKSYKNFDSTDGEFLI